jgi:hypothetical protein
VFQFDLGQTHKQGGYHPSAVIREGNVLLQPGTHRLIHGDAYQKALAATFAARASASLLKETALAAARVVLWGGTPLVGLAGRSGRYLPFTFSARGRSLRIFAAPAGKG